MMDYYFYVDGRAVWLCVGVGSQVLNDWQIAIIVKGRDSGFAKERVFLGVFVGSFSGWCFVYFWFFSCS